MRRVRLVWVTSLMALILVLAGCGGAVPLTKEASAPEPAKSAPLASQPKETTQVNVSSGDRGSFLYLPMLVAEQLGYFTEQGLKLNITEQKGGAQVAQALISGEADFGSTVTDHAPKYKAQGVDLAVIALYTRLPGSALVVDTRYANTIKSVKDLRGKKVGVTSPGSGSYQSMLAMLDVEGLSPADVEILGVGFDMAKAFKENKVVAGVTYDPYITMVTSSGAGKIVQYDLRTEKDTKTLFGTDYPFGALLTRADMIENKPDTVEKMVKAIVKADKWIASHNAREIAAIIPAQYKPDEALFVTALEATKPTISTDGVVSIEGMQTVISVLKKLKVIPDSVKVEAKDVINMKFVQK